MTSILEVAPGGTLPIDFLGWNVGYFVYVLIGKAGRFRVGRLVNIMVKIK